MNVFMNRAFITFMGVFAVIIFILVSGMIDINERRPVMAGTIDKKVSGDVVPGMDKQKPERTETATFALG